MTYPGRPATDATRAVRAAGFDTTTLVTVTNTKAINNAEGSVTPLAGRDAAAGDAVIEVTR